MPKWTHRMTEVDPLARTATCSNCGPTRIKRNEGKHWRCIGGVKPYGVYKLDTCAECGFIATHLSQMDIDHIDGNHKNNNIENLQTLCANCHRLKTWIHDSKKVFA